jgi:SAM-dependent methyltransferase
MNGKNEVMEILGKARSFWEARILMSAAELDVFAPLKDGPKTAEQVAKKLGSDLRGTEMLLDALVGLRLLVKEKSAFSIRPGFEKALSSSSPETVLPMILHMAHMWDSWGKLTDIVRKGKQAEAEEVIGRDEAGLKAFIGAMHAIGRGRADEVVARLDLSAHKKLIDVGGGSGVYTIAALRAAPHMVATLFDRPPVIEIARQKLAEEGLTDRATFVKGDFYKDALPGGHDLALLSAIIHMNSREQNVDLYRKIRDALVPGGVLVIRDHVMNDEHTEPPEGTFFAINMLVNTPGGGTYSFNEIREDFEAAGFKDAKLAYRGHGQMESLVTAKRPA